ncbi:hypothetical protein PAPYR_2153 [Paratrimastix pyriformis]|uniref:Uncharacterized protein n=1 Tax=Paratrimastix pyriformis TaxID=342808 RepID=A0ABQ8URT6_9EUKA|nr:hypothetical protein PAPYR_2153 [Paratrimastix pyriformis]
MSAESEPLRTTVYDETGAVLFQTIWNSAEILTECYRDDRVWFLSQNLYNFASSIEGGEGTEKDVVRVIFNTHLDQRPHMRRSELDFGMVCAQNAERRVKSFTFHNHTSGNNREVQAFNREALSAFLAHCGGALEEVRKQVAQTPARKDELFSQFHTRFHVSFREILDRMRHERFPPAVPPTSPRSSLGGTPIATVTSSPPMSAPASQWSDARGTVPTMENPLEASPIPVPMPPQLQWGGRGWTPANENHRGSSLFPAQANAFMFHSAGHLARRTGKYGTSRPDYLRELVAKFQNTEDDPKSQLPVLCRLANIAYDPINYEWVRQLRIIDLFKDCIDLADVDMTSSITHAAVAGLCNLSPDFANHADIIGNDGLAVLTRALTSGVRHLVAMGGASDPLATHTVACASVTHLLTTLTYLQHGPQGSRVRQTLSGLPAVLEPLRATHSRGDAAQPPGPHPSSYSTSRRACCVQLKNMLEG